MFIGAFVAGSVFPFSSETLLAGLLLAQLDPWRLFFSATIGNVMGSMFNYYIGSHFRIERIERIMRIKREKIERTRIFLDRHGWLTGILSIVPFLGSAVTVTLGYTHARFWPAMLNILAAKAIRYWIIIFLLDMIKG
ncbi:MAG: DedA family protein [Bacteroidaceae bacterium]|nr:DedA family protein [Bacteroidaceae bacterium]